jgi:hypothetical protein
MRAGDWVWSEEHHEAGRVVDAGALWGDSFARVWLPVRDVVVRVGSERVRPLGDDHQAKAAHLTYVTAAARVADTLTQDVLLAPIESTVIPLPHQLLALGRAMGSDRVRFLLADEVGLGKTIEAGLILRELKLRGLVRRTLVVIPRGLVTQWISEMQVHFGEEFRLLDPGDFAAYRALARDRNLWRNFPQVVCPLDSVKPLDNRRGWSRQDVAEYNRDRFEDLVTPIFYSRPPENRAFEGRPLYEKGWRGGRTGKV